MEDIEEGGFTAVKVPDYLVGFGQLVTNLSQVCAKHFHPPSLNKKKKQYNPEWSGSVSFEPV